MAKIAIYSQDVVGEAMAGPAIRCWEFAKELSKEHTVSLIIPNETTLSNDQFQLVPRKGSAHHQPLSEADLIITQVTPPFLIYLAKKYGIKLIIDAYCPVILEVLELFKDLPQNQKDLMISHIIRDQLRSFKMADGIICASEKQRDLWLGFLMSFQKLGNQYVQDSTLRHFIDIVPFGLSSIPMPPKSGPGPRELFKIGPHDKILLWAGALSDWFDPCTLIRAMKRISLLRNDVKCVFMAVKHPNQAIPKMSIATQAIELAKQLDLYDKQVFFNDLWIPYKDRHNFLSEATIGISIHPEHLETRFSFRTRMLDYLWAGLPIISSQGDGFADIIQNYQLGKVVAYHDDEKLAEVIIEIVDDDKKIKHFRSNVLKLSTEFHWEKAMTPLKKMILELTKEKKKAAKLSLKDFWIVGEAYWEELKYITKKIGIKKTTQRAFDILTKALFSKTLANRSIF